MSLTPTGVLWRPPTPTGSGSRAGAEDLRTFYRNVQHLVLALSVNKSSRGSRLKGTHTGCFGQLPNCRMLWENLRGSQKKGTALCSGGSLGRLARSFSMINTLTFLQKEPKTAEANLFCELKHVSLFTAPPIHCFSQIYCSCVRWNGERKGDLSNYPLMVPEKTYEFLPQ